MKLGLFTPVFGNLSTGEMLAKVKRLEGIQALELGTGGWPGCNHEDYKLVSDAGFTISALSCHSNPLHPDPKTAKEADVVFRKSVTLAEKLGVPVVVTFAGCPGDSEDAKHPNWVTNPWPPEFHEVLDWQWEKKTIPYWKEAAKFAADHGVKVALEAHPGFIVYNVETMLRLRAAVDLLSRVILTEPPVDAWWT